MIIPLWTKDNDTVDSSFFAVVPGTIVTLLAVGLEQFKVRQDSRESRSPQCVCVARVIHEAIPTPPSKAAKGPDCGPCGRFVFPPCNMPASVNIVEEVIAQNGQQLTLSTCHNFIVLDIPGWYRLHLNDDTAIGKVQVYAEQYGHSHLPGISRMPTHEGVAIERNDLWL